MPKRSRIETELPEDLRGKLNKRLINNGFSDYVALAEWLRESGFEISKSSLHRYGQDFEERLEQLKAATEQAKAIAEAIPDDEGAMNDALTRLTQEKLFNVLKDMEVDPTKVSITALGKVVSELNRSSVQQKKWMQEMRAKTKEKERQRAADIVKDIVRTGGLSGEGGEEIRARILGIKT